MVDEYLSEREQAEQLRFWLRQNGIWLLAGVALTVGGYYGYRWWESRGAQRSIEAGERFAAMLDAIGGGKRDEGLKIAGEVTGEYRRHALCGPGEPRARAGSTWTPETSRAPERALRRSPRSRRTRTSGSSRELRLARVQLAEGRYDEALKSLDAVATPALDPRVLELRGDVKLAQGDKGAALDFWRKAQAAVKAGSCRAGAQVDAELLGLKIDELSAAGPAE